jgi:hypothetical protein
MQWKMTNINCSNCVLFCERVFLRNPSDNRWLVLERARCAPCYRCVKPSQPWSCRTFFTTLSFAFGLFWLAGRVRRNHVTACRSGPAGLNIYHADQCMQDGLKHMTQTAWGSGPAGLYIYVPCRSVHACLKHMTACRSGPAGINIYHADQCMQV